MEIRIATDADAQLWDSIVDRSPNGSLFHTWKWLKLIEKYSVLKMAGMKANARLDPLILTENGKPVGIYPLFFFRTMGLTYCYSPPSQEDTLFLGPLFSGPNGTRPDASQVFLVAMQKEIDRFIKKTRKSSYVQISTPPGFDDCRPFKWAGYRAEPRYTYQIDLSSGTEGVFNGLNPRLRQIIKKAKKDGVVVSEGDKADALYIYDLLRKRNRIKFHQDFVGSAFDHFSPDNMKVFIARRGSERLGGVITILYKDKMSLWIGLPKLPVSTNELVVWESIEWAGAHGYKNYEIISANEYPLFPFKRKFNGKLVQFFLLKWYSPALDVFVSAHNLLFKKQRNHLEEAVA